MVVPNGVTPSGAPHELLRDEVRRMSAEDNSHLLNSASDRILVGRAADGDTEAFSIMVRRYGRLLRVFLAGITDDQSEIDRLVCATLESAWRELPHLCQADYLQVFLILIAAAEARAGFPKADRPAA